MLETKVCSGLPCMPWFHNVQAIIKLCIVFLHRLIRSSALQKDKAYKRLQNIKNFVSLFMSEMNLEAPVHVTKTYMQN